MMKDPIGAEMKRGKIGRIGKRGQIGQIEKGAKKPQGQMARAAHHAPCTEEQSARETPHTPCTEEQSARETPHAPCTVLSIDAFRAAQKTSPLSYPSSSYAPSTAADKSDKNERDLIHAAFLRFTASLVANAFKISPPALYAQTRSKAHIAFARQITLYLIHVVCRISISQSAKLLKRDRTTATHACHHVEDRRDDPNIDDALNHLEAVLLAWSAFLLKH